MIFTRKLVDTSLAVKRRVYENRHVNKIFRDASSQELPIDSNISPVFIVGCGHSGTSLLCAVMDSHPRLQALPGENYNFWAWLDRKKVVSRFDNAFQEISKNQMRPLEKTPRHVYVLPQILAFYPSAQVIFMIRDPRGVAASIEKRTGSFRRGYRRWIKDNSMALPFLSDPRLKVFKFEDFLLNKERVLSEICDYIGLAFDDALLNHNKKQRQWYGVGDEDSEHAKRRYQQINQPINPDFVDDWKARLSKPKQIEVEKSCSELMRVFDY